VTIANVLSDELKSRLFNKPKSMTEKEESNFRLTNTLICSTVFEIFKYNFRLSGTPNPDTYSQRMSQLMLAKLMKVYDF